MGLLGFFLFCFVFLFRPTRRFRKYCLAEWILKWVNASRRLLVSDFSHPALWIFLRGTSWWYAALDRWLSAKLFLFLCRQPPSHWLTIDLNSPGVQWSGLLWLDISSCAVMYLAFWGDYASPVWSLRGHLIFQQNCNNPPSAPVVSLSLLRGRKRRCWCWCWWFSVAVLKEVFSQMKTSHEYLSRVWQFDSGHKWHS